MKIENTQIAASLLIYKLASDPKLTPIFDLDGVLLSAEHRIKLKPCGALDLDHYRENTTAHQVAQDRDLPLLSVVHWLNQAGRVYHVATARIPCEFTRARLRASQINPLILMGRDGHTDRRGDAILKAEKIAANFKPWELGDLILVDDLESNCEAARSLGLGSVHVLTDHGILIR
jgi:FMN phosphatase YigB (HAD superfamily)